MRRREAIALLGGAAAASPFVARAQQRTMPVIGFLSSRSPGESTAVVAAFRKGLAEAGFVEGRNLVIAFRWAEGSYDRLPALASELVAIKPAAIFAAGGAPSALAIKAATSTIPIIFSGIGDPVRAGVVASLNRPGGNVTGFSLLTTELEPKRLELLRELVPAASTVAILVNPGNPTSEAGATVAEAAARGIGQRVLRLDAASEADIDTAFATMAQRAVGALIVGTDPFFVSQRERLAALAARHAIPTIYSWRENVAAGGLMSYGVSITERYHQAGVYVGRVLKGEKPADLPVQQPTTFELVINLKTAKALGLTIPESIMVRADEVIE